MSMTLELKTGEYIEKLVSGKPKSFAYKIDHPGTVRRKTVCKARGLTLNYSSSQLVNMMSLRK